MYKQAPKTNLFLVVYVYGVVLSVATCTFVYKQAPKQTYLTGGLVVYVFGVVLLVATCTSGYKQAPHKPILQGFSCLCLLGGECAFSRILYSGVQTGAIETRKKYLPIHRLQITGTSISVQVDL